MLTNELEQELYQAKVRDPMLPRGRYGCLARATTSRLYGQFPGVAISTLLYDFVIVKRLFVTIDELNDGDGAMYFQMSQIYSKLHEKGIIFDATSIMPESVIEASPGELRSQSISLSCSDETYEKMAEEHRAWREDKIEAARVGVKIADPDLYQFKIYDHLSNFVTAKCHQFEARSILSEYVIASYLNSAGIDVDDTPFTGEIPYREDIRDDIYQLMIPLWQEEATVANDPRSFSIAIERVPFPKTIGVDDIEKFRNAEIVCNSIGKIRGIVGELVHSRELAMDALENFSKSYLAYQREILATGLDICFCDVKFRFGCDDEDHAGAIKSRFLTGLCYPFVLQYAESDQLSASKKVDTHLSGFLLEIEESSVGYGQVMPDPKT